MDGVDEVDRVSAAKELWGTKRGSGVHLGLLVASCVALWGWNYGLYDLSGFDEGRYVQVAKELLGRGNPFQLTVQGEPYAEKPPLGFWLMAAGLRLNGGRVSSWAARLPGALAATITVVLTYLIGRRLFGAQAGLIAAFVLVTAPVFLEEAAAARLDVLYAAWTTLAFFAWLTREEGRKVSWGRFGLFWGSLAGAFFVKGPLALLIVFAVVAYEGWGARSWGRIGEARPVLGVVVLGGLIGGWLLAHGQMSGPGAVQRLVLGQTAERMAQGSHGEPFWYYLPRLFLSIFFPWMFVAAAAFWHLWRRRGEGGNGALGPLVAWSIFPIVLLSFSHGKRQQYMLPVLPGLALITGWYLDGVMLGRVGRAWIGKIVFWIGVGLGCALAGGAVYIIAFPKVAANPDFMLTWRHAVGWVAAALALVGLMVWMRRQNWTSGAVLAAFIGLLAIGQLCMNLTVFTARNGYRSSREFSQFLDSLCREEPGPPVVGVMGGAEEPKYHVYGSYRVRPVDIRSRSGGAQEALPAVLVAQARYKSRFGDALAGLGYAPAAQMRAAGDQLIVFKRRSRAD